MDSILMIAGGLQQRPALEVARSLGLRTIVADRSPNAPAMADADISVCVDGRDVEAMVAWTLMHKEDLGIRGVFTISELVTTAASVAAAAGLPSASLAATVACQNKALCKRVFLEAGIATPAGGAAETLEEAEALLRRLGVSAQRPAFVKPAVGFGAQGALRIERSSDPALRALFATKTRWSQVVVESFCTGSMHDVSGLFDAAGMFHPMGIVDRFFKGDQPVETGIEAPSRLSDAEQGRLYQLLEDAMRALGIAFGPVKGDAILTDEGFKLFEVAPRLHGPKNTLRVLPLAGFEPLTPTLQVLTGAAPDPGRLRIAPHRASACRALIAPPGRVSRLRGASAARALPGIDSIDLYARPGEVPLGVAGHVFATGESVADCRAALDAAERQISIETEISVGLARQNAGCPA